MFKYSLLPFSPIIQSFSFHPRQQSIVPGWKISAPAISINSRLLVSGRNNLFAYPGNHEFVYFSLFTRKWN